MIWRLRFWFGVVLIAVAGFGLVRCIAEPGEQRLGATISEAHTLSLLEAKLLREIDRTLTARTSVSFPSELAWPATDRLTAELAVQNAVVEIATGVDILVLSFGASSMGSTGDVPSVSYDFELQGGHVEFTRFLAEIEAHQPALAVSYLWIRPLPIDPDQPIAPLSARLTVWGLYEPVGESP